MNSTAPSYKRLPGVGHQVGSYTKLYRGPDHLLQVSSVTFSERYKRFFFRDIQAFVVMRTSGWIIWFIVNIGISLLFTAISVGVGESVPSIVFGSIAALFMVFAIINLLRGPTCRCYVQTAVQTERLPSLKRMRRTEKLLLELKPLIEAAQNTVPATAIQSPAP